MIKTREQLRAEADASVAEFAELIAGQEESTGIPRPPKIETSEIALETTPFDFGIIAEPETEVFQGEPAPQAGCPSGDLILTFSGVVIACGCLTAEPIWRSLTVTEDAGINSAFTLASDPGGVCGTPCEWDLLGQFGLVADQPYNNADCTDPISVGATAVAFFATLISGTFRVLVISDAGLFFGSAAFGGTFPVVISNTLSCTADVQTLNVGCDFSSIVTFVGVGGTCTITQ